MSTPSAPVGGANQGKRPPFWIFPVISVLIAVICAVGIWLALRQHDAAMARLAHGTEGRSQTSGQPDITFVETTATGDAGGTPTPGEAGLIASKGLDRHVPDFAFTERSGKIVRRADLIGKVWVADFIFTHCAGTCPVMTSSLRSVQERCKDVPDLRLVSFTVDPERDTAAVLKDYASAQGADPERWLFLTGDKKTMYEFINTGFLLPVGVQPNDPNVPGIEAIMHSPRFVLVDRDGRLKAMYLGNEKESVDKLVADLHAMAAQ